MLWYIYMELPLIKSSYPDNVDPCSIEQVMPDHCSVGLLTLSLLASDFPRMER